MGGRKSYTVEHEEKHCGYASRAVLCRSGEWPDDAVVTVHEYVKSIDHWMDLASITPGELRNEARIHPPAVTQRVVLNNRWTYLWRGNSELAIGEQVMVPANEFYPSQVMTVTGLESDYDGYLVQIVGRVA